MASLAIIIPAYKSEFLAKTLDSLVMQTNRNFSVYIGNDAGDSRIEEIVQCYTNRLNIRYQYFETNLGRVSLVKQWERCFAVTQNEEWLWLLPDDDFIDPNCVELFYSRLAENNFDVFRFNVHFVTADGKIFKTNTPLPSVQSSFENLIEKLSFSRPGTVAEFIFGRRIFEQIGFTEMLMAWGTDDLLWFRMGREKGIFGCNEASVYLRQSHLNISNNYSSLAIKKINANFMFFAKLMETDAFKQEMMDENKKKRFVKVALEHILYNLQDFSIKLKVLEMYHFAVKGSRIWGGGILRNMWRFYLNNKRIP